MTSAIQEQTGEVAVHPYDVAASEMKDELHKNTKELRSTLETGVTSFLIQEVKDYANPLIGKVLLVFNIFNIPVPTESEKPPQQQMDELVERVVSVSVEKASQESEESANCVGDTSIDAGWDIMKLASSITGYFYGSN